MSLWSDVLDMGEVFEMARVARDPDFLAAALLAKHLTSFRARLEIRQAISSALGGSPWSRRETNLATRRNIRVNQGALILPPNGPFQVNPRHEIWVYPDVVVVDRLNGVYMERFLELAESREIPVFWLLTPVCPAIQSHGERAGTAETHARFVREVQRRHRRITVVDGRRSGYPEAAMDDSIHLSRSGAAVFSADLADAMARVLEGKADGSAWAELPPFRDRPIDFRHEDLAESRRAMTPTARR